LPIENPLHEVEHRYSNFSVEVLKLQRQRNLAASVFLTQRAVDSCSWTAAFVRPFPSAASCLLLVRRLLLDSQPRIHLQGRRLALQVRDWAAARCYGHACTIRTCVALRAIAYANSAFLLDYRGVVLALITVFIYMLTDMGHYGVFKLPKYGTTPKGSSSPPLCSPCLVSLPNGISSEIDGSSHPKVAKFVAATCQALVTDRLCRAAHQCLFPSPQNS
jgi:hypothetical protein